MAIALFSRRVVGWTLAPRMGAVLVVEALQRALCHRQVEPEKLLLHPDQDSRYRATDYRGLLGENGMVCSMSAQGCCTDNAEVARSFSTMMRDLDDSRQAMISPRRLQIELAFWNEGYHHCERRHSTIAYPGPIDDEQRSIAACTRKPVSP